MAAVLSLPNWWLSKERFSIISPTISGFVAKKRFSARAVVWRPKSSFVYNRLQFFLINQLFRREFCIPIERSSSRALDRRRHP